MHHPAPVCPRRMCSAVRLALFIAALMTTDARAASPADTPLDEWAARFTTIPGQRIRVFEQAEKPPGTAVLPGGSSDFIFMWPEGVRCTTYLPGAVLPAFEGAAAPEIPDPYGPAVDYVSVIGPGIAIRRSDRNGMFERTTGAEAGNWFIQHGFDMGMRSEWVVARVAAAGGLGTLEEKWRSDGWRRSQARPRSHRSRTQHHWSPCAERCSLWRRCI